MPPDSELNHQPSQRRVAWLFPSLERGSYWHPLFASFSQQFPQTVIYTGLWPGFATGFEASFTVQVIGKTKLFYTDKTDSGYSRSYILPSLSIIPKLLSHRPNVIFTSAFSLWTLVAIFCKFFMGSRVIVLFDGVSPGEDYLNSGIRIYPRRIMRWLIDAFVSNSHAGKQYLTQVVWAGSDQVFVQPYLVPDLSALTAQSPSSPKINSLAPSGRSAEVSATVNTEKPSLNLATAHATKTTVFLCIGQIISRKGLHFALRACALLKAQGYEQFRLQLIGEGPERSALEALAQEEGLQNCVQWVGAVNYHQLGEYFRQADVFIFPTLEDIWGMVVPEAMVFGCPVLCSKWAGATEIMAAEENGYIFDPYNVEQLSELMRRFIDNPSLVKRMGDRSKELATALTPQRTAAFFSQLAASV